MECTSREAQARQPLTPFPASHGWLRPRSQPAGSAVRITDQDGCANAEAFVKLLDEKGWDVKHVVEIGGEHDWAYWQKRWPQMLARFREGRSGCE